MRTTPQILAGLAFFAAFGSSTTLIWTGSTGTNPTSGPYYACNDTTIGATGTALPTGTAPSNSTTKTLIKTACVTTTTITLSSTSTTATGSALSTWTVYGSDVYYIGASEVSPTNGTATLTLRSTATLTLPETATETGVVFAETTTGIPSTITISPPSGFLPVQSSLPNATYNYCNESTAYSTTTRVITTSSVTTRTIHGPVVLYYNQGDILAVPATDITTNFSISFVTQTSSVTGYAATVTTTSTSTFTYPATTRSVYPACETNNFANDIVVDSGRSAVPIRFFDLTARQSISRIELANLGVYGCCALAFDQGVDAWAFDARDGCALLVDDDETCSPFNTTLTAQWGPKSALGYHLVVGNAGCGQFTNLEYISS